jgi:hypothetical protein
MPGRERKQEGGRRDAHRDGPEAGQVFQGRRDARTGADRRAECAQFGKIDLHLDDAGKRGGREDGDGQHAKVAEALLIQEYR